MNQETDSSHLTSAVPCPVTSGLSLHHGAWVILAMHPRVIQTSLHTADIILTILPDPLLSFLLYSAFPVQTLTKSHLFSAPELSLACSMQPALVNSAHPKSGVHLSLTPAMCPSWADILPLPQASLAPHSEQGPGKLNG